MSKNYDHEVEVLSKGESIYLDSLKDQLEQDYLGCYVAIDVDTRDHLVNANRMHLIEQAKKKFGQKKFYVTQIGNLTERTINFRGHQNVEWLFS